MQDLSSLVPAEHLFSLRTSVVHHFPLLFCPKLSHSPIVLSNSLYGTVRARKAPLLSTAPGDDPIFNYNNGKENE